MDQIRAAGGSSVILKIIGTHHAEEFISRIYESCGKAPGEEAVDKPILFTPSQSPSRRTP